MAVPALAEYAMHDGQTFLRVLFSCLLEIDDGSLHKVILQTCSLLLDYNRFMLIPHKAEHVYIHIPFCIRKCAYCDFCSVPHDTFLAESYVRALLQELKRRAYEIGPVRSVFFGGGTPTLLPADLFSEILNALHRSCSFEQNAEITIEANPATLDLVKCTALKSAGVNRISIGVQSAHAEELSVLGRVHEWRDVVDTCTSVRNAGFENLSLDLMYGIPGQTIASWRGSLEQVLALAPEHLSAYELTPEVDTPLADALGAGLLSLPSDDAVAEMYFLTDAMLGDRGFEHYEISNYALPGQRCRHNMAYWQRRPYIGLGAAAHSFDGVTRSGNGDDIPRYIEGMERGGSVVTESTQISHKDDLQERIFLGLRLADGIARSLFTDAEWGGIEKALQTYVMQGLASSGTDCFRLTSRGWLVSNQIIASILSDTEKLLP